MNICRQHTDKKTKSKYTYSGQCSFTCFDQFPDDNMMCGKCKKYLFVDKKGNPNCIKDCGKTDKPYYDVIDGENICVKECPSERRFRYDGKKCVENCTNTDKKIIKGDKCLGPEPKGFEIGIIIFVSFALLLIIVVGIFGYCIGRKKSSDYPAAEEYSMHTEHVEMS